MSPDLALYSTSYLSDETLALLFDGCPTMSFSAGDIVFSAGDPCTDIFLVRSGKLMTYKFSHDGKQIFDSIYRKGSTVGFRDAFSSPIHLAYCKVQEDAVLSACPISEFIQRAYEHDLWVEIVQGEMKKTNFGIRSYKPASKVEIFRRLRIMENEGMTQNEMAMILGYSRVQISRLVNEMYRSLDPGDKK